MTYYLIPLIFLSIFTFLENSKKLINLVKSKFFYSIIALFFIFFIGLRYKIGCDWESYVTLIDKYLSLNILEILKYNLTGYSQYENFPNHYFVIQELGHVFLSIISKNIYILNLIYATIFVIPLFYFCWNLKRTYLSLLISYPYYMIVVGMGPIRQAACISIVMISIIFISKKKYFLHFIATAFSLFIHQYSIIFNGILFTPLLINLLREKISKKNILFLIIIFSIILYNLPSYLAKSYFYLMDPYGAGVISIASIFIWIINFIPAIIYLKNNQNFPFNKNMKEIINYLSIFEIVILPLVFLKSVIAYRLLLYCFPASILITSYIPDSRIFKIKNNSLINIIIISSFVTLIFWLKYAVHSSCWLPYKNILIN